MARYRKIDVRIWNDSKFASLSDTAQLAFLFLLTHPTMTPLGALRGSPETLAFDKYGFEDSTKAFREAFIKAFQELSEKGLVKVDSRGLLFAVNFLKYNVPESPNVIKSWKGSVDYLPECELLNEVLESAKVSVSSMSEGYQKAFREAFKEDLQGLSEKALLKAMPNQEQEQEQEQELFSDTDVSLVKSSEVACDDSETQKIETTREACPYEKIADVYNEVLGDRLGHCMKLTPTRKTNVRARWLEAKKEGWFEDDPTGVEFFRRYFIHVSGSNFLMGNKKPRLGESTAWRASFDFLFKSENFTKIREGQYHR